MSNIFSPNYSVGTALCTLQCPGSRMAWWVTACAKLRPPLIVLSLDFPYSLLSMCGTSALVLPSWLGRLTAPCRGWCRVSSTGCLTGQTPSVWTGQLLISVISVLIQRRWKIPQLGTNLSSCEVSDLPLPPADASRVAPSLWDASRILRCSRCVPSVAGACRGTRRCSSGRWSLAKTPTKRKQLLVLLVPSETCFVVLIVFPPSKACGWHTNEWDAYQLFFSFFFF